MTEAALGYYLTPLLNVAAGMLLFGERLSRLKALALIIAGIGVLSVAVLVGSWPWFDWRSDLALRPILDPKGKGRGYPRTRGRILLVVSDLGDLSVGLGRH